MPEENDKEGMKGGEKKMGTIMADIQVIPPKNIQVPVHKCEKCGHTWIGRTQRIPRMCPKCKTVNWDIPRKSRK